MNSLSFRRPVNVHRSYEHIRACHYVYILLCVVLAAGPAAAEASQAPCDADSIGMYFSHDSILML